MPFRQPFQFLLLIGALLLGVFPRLTVAGSANTPFLQLTLHHNRLSLTARNTDSCAILHAVCQQTTLSCQLPAHCPEAPIAGLQFQDRPLPEAIKRITAPTNRQASIDWDHGALHLGNSPAVARPAIDHSGPIAITIVDGSQRPQVPAAAATPLPATPPARPGELLLTWKPRTSPAARRALHHRLGSTVLRTLDGADLELIRICRNCEPSERIAAYRHSGLIKTVEPNFLRSPHALAANDPAFADQWGIRNAGIDQAWETTTGDGEIIVAVLDTGFSDTHPELAANLWTNEIEAAGITGRDDDANGYIDDIHGWDFGERDSDPVGPSPHATEVAAILGAVGNNGSGIAGVAWRVRLMNLKVALDQDDSIDIAAVIEALAYARHHGARLINCSFGGAGASDTEQQAFQKAANDGILAICSAGNGHLNIDGTGSGNFPAGYPLANIISVTALKQTEQLADFADYGPISVDLAAPGALITTLTNTVTPTPTVIQVSGTSLAAPFVTGSAALLAAARPRIAGQTIKKLLLTNGRPLPDLAAKTLTGATLDTGRAMAALPAGDLNCDGLLTLGDVLAGLGVAVREPGPALSCPGNDGNSDHRLDPLDSLLLLQGLLLR